MSGCALYIVFIFRGKSGEIWVQFSYSPTISTSGHLSMNARLIQGASRQQDKKHEKTAA